MTRGFRRLLAYLGWGILIFIFSLLGCSTSTHLEPTVIPTQASITEDVSKPTKTPTSTPVSISPSTVSYLSEISSFGKGVSEAAAWSPDMQTLAIATSLGIDLYDAETYEQIGFLKTGGQWNTNLVYSPDGSLLAVVGENGEIEVWDTGREQRVYRQEQECQRVYGGGPPLAFSPDGKQLITGCNQTVHFWDALTGELLASYPGYTNGVNNLAISPDGNILLVDSLGTIRARDLSTGELLYQPIETGAETLFFSPEGEKFVTVSYQSTSNSELGLSEPGINYQSQVRYWDTASGKLLEEYDAARDIVYCVAVSPDQEWIVTGGLDGVTVWDATSQTVFSSLKGHTGRITALAFSPDGEKLVSIGGGYGGGDASVIVWDFNTREPVKEFDEYSGMLQSAILSADERRVAVVGTDRKVQIRDTHTGQLLQTFSGNSPLAFSPDGKILALAWGQEKEILLTKNSINDVIKLVDVETGKSLPKGTFSCPSAVAVAFSPDGQTVAYGGEDCKITLRDVNSGDILSMLDKAQYYGGGISRYYIESLAFSPDGQRLAVGGIYTVEIWDIQTEELLHVIEGLEFDTRVAFSPDGRYLAVSGFGSYSENAQVQIWDMFSYQQVFTLSTQMGKVWSLAFSPDGQILAISGEDVEFWDAWTGEPLYQIDTSAEWIVGLGFSADRQALMTVGNNGVVQLWQVLSAPEIAQAPRSTPTPLPTYTPTPTPLSLEIDKIAALGQGMLSPVYRSPDGELIAVGDGETLRWYDTETFEEIGSLKVGEGGMVIGPVTFSPDGKLGAVEGLFNIQVVDFANRSVVAEISGWSKDGVYSPAFSPDSQFITFLAADGTTGGPYHYIGLWDVVDDKDIGYDPYVEDGFHFKTLTSDRYHRMTAPSISPDGRWVAAGYSDSLNELVYIFDLQSGETRFALEGHAGKVTSVDFSPDGRYLASGSEDGTVRLWNPATGKLERVITGLLRDVTWVEFSPDGQSLEINLRDMPAQVYNLNTGELGPQETPQPTPDPFAVYLHQQGYLDGKWSTRSLFSPDGRGLVVFSESALVWDLPSGELRTSLENPGGGDIRCLAFSPDSTRIVAIDDNDRLLIWNTQSGEQLFSLPVGTEDGPIMYEEGLAVSPDSRVFAFVNDARVEIWDLETARQVRTLDIGQGDFAGGVSFSSDGSQLYVLLGRNQAVQTWDYQSGKLLRQIDLPSPDNSGSTALNGPWLARLRNEDEQKWIELWDLNAETYLKIETNFSYGVSLDFSPDGSLLVGTSDGDVYFWETATGQIIYRWEDGLAGYNSYQLDISPDNNILVIGYEGQGILWDIGGIAQAIQQSAFSPSTPRPTTAPSISYWPTETPQPTQSAPPTPLPFLSDEAISLESAAQVVELSYFGNGTVEDIEWSSNGLTITLAGSQGIFQYDAGDLAEIDRLETESWTYSLVNLPDGGQLAASSINGQAQIWDVAARHLIAGLQGSEPALSPDGKLLVYLDQNDNLQTWDVESAQPVATLYSLSYHSSHWPVFNPDSSLVAAIQTSDDRFGGDWVRVWNAHTGGIVNALGGPDNEITDLSFSDDGQYLVGAADGSVWIWDVRPGALPYTITLYAGEIDYNLNIFEESVTAAALSPDNRVVAIGTSEKSVWLYERASRRALRELEGHTNAIHRLRFSPDGKFLLSVDQDGGLILWDTASGERLNTLYAHTGAINGLAFRSDGDLAVWQGGTAWTLHPPDGELLHTTRIYSGTIMAVSPAGDWLAVYNPYSISLWDARTGEYWKTLEGEAEDVFIDYHDEGEIFQQFNAAAFSDDGALLVAAGSGGNWVYDGRDGRLIQQFTSFHVLDTEISVDNEWLVTCHSYGYGSWLEIMDTETGSDNFSPDGGNCWPHRFKFSPDNRWVGILVQTWGKPYRFEIWDTSTQELFKSIPFSEEIPLTGLAFSPDAHLAVIAQENGLIFLVDLTTFEVVTVLEGHIGSVEHLAFSQDGLYLASGGKDGMVRVWGVP